MIILISAWMLSLPLKSTAKEIDSPSFSSFKELENLFQNHDSSQPLHFSAKQGRIHLKTGKKIWTQSTFKQEGATLISQSTEMHPKKWIFLDNRLRKGNLTLKSPKLIWNSETKQLICPQSCQLAIHETHFVAQSLIFHFQTKMIELENLKGSTQP